MDSDFFLIHFLWVEWVIAKLSDRVDRLLERSIGRLLSMVFCFIHARGYILYTCVLGLSPPPQPNMPSNEMNLLIK